MDRSIVGLFLILGLAIALAIRTGRYLRWVFCGNPDAGNRPRPSLEHLVYRLGGIRPEQSMNWKQYLMAMGWINAVWLVWGFGMLLVQSRQPFWNQGNIANMEWTLALNTAISFLTSTNLQHYAGETGATYGTQMLVLLFLQFVSAGTSLATGVALVRGLQARSGTQLGNFYVDLTRALLYVFLPLSLLAATLLVLAGVPMTFEPYDLVRTLQGAEQTVARGPVAAMLPIKHLGSNGGGFFGTNTAHPFENPSFFTYIVNLITVLLLPMAFVCFAGRFLNRRKWGRILFGVMTAGFILVTIPILEEEMLGNPAISALGIRQDAGNLEGKEMRFGTLASAFWCGVNVVIPAGTLTSMHDSYTPLSGVFMLTGMQLDAFYGGVGTGFMYLFLYIVIAVFIGSLMIGRTPELLGKKLGQTEIQLATGVTVAQPLIYLSLTAVAAYVYQTTPEAATTLGWLSNQTAGPPDRGPNGYHGFTALLYEYVSATAGNGSGFEGLGDNTPFWNLTTALAMLLGRFVPIIGPVAISGLLFAKPYTPPSPGSLPVESYTFGGFLLVVILIIGALCFFPTLAIGPIAEFFTQ